MSNQWPEFDKLPKTPTVRSILLAEGNGVSERTNGEVRFVVESEPSGQGGLLHRCLLIVPKVGYRYPLLRVVQDQLDYPVTVVADVWPQGTTAGNEAELRKALGKVFRSDAVKKVVPQLLELVS
jgi:hypothetical protein